MYVCSVCVEASSRVKHRERNPTSLLVRKCDCGPGKLESLDPIELSCRTRITGGRNIYNLIMNWKYTQELSCWTGVQMVLK